MAFALPLASFAQTTTPTSTLATIQALLQQIKTLQSQLAALQAQQHTLVQQYTGAVSDLARSLSRGVSGDDVKVLQALLAADPDIYPEGLITGFFGPATAKAVAKFQAKNGLETVGYVRHKTHKLLKHILKLNPVAMENSTSTVPGEGHGKLCAIVPPGHLIAPGWLKKNGGVQPVVPACQTLPPGIIGILNGTKGTSTGTSTGTTTPPTSTTTPDVTAPIISSVGVSSIASTSGVVSWMTNEVATGKVYFSTANPVDINSSSTMNVYSTSLSQAHTFSLTGLASSTTYYYVVESKDASNNTATTTSQAFATTAN